MKALLLIVSLLFLVGCASTSGYYESVNHANDTASKIELAKAQAEVERVRALQNISQNGGPTAQTAAVMALTFAGQQNGNNSNGPRVAMPGQPKSANDYALEWASVLIPGVTSLYGINQNTRVQLNSSNNSRDVSLSTNETMLGFGYLTADKDIPITAENTTRTTNEDGSTTDTTETELIFPTQ